MTGQQKKLSKEFTCKITLRPLKRQTTHFPNWWAGWDFGTLRLHMVEAWFDMHSPRFGMTATFNFAEAIIFKPQRGSLLRWWDGFSTDFSTIMALPCHFGTFGLAIRLVPFLDSEHYYVTPSAWLVCCLTYLCLHSAISIAGWRLSAFSRPAGRLSFAFESCDDGSWD